MWMLPLDDVSKNVVALLLSISLAFISKPVEKAITTLIFDFLLFWLNELDLKKRRKLDFNFKEVLYVCH